MKVLMIQSENTSRSPGLALSATKSSVFCSSHADASILRKKLSPPLGRDNQPRRKEMSWSAGRAKVKTSRARIKAASVEIYQTIRKPCWATQVFPHCILRALLESREISPIAVSPLYARERASTIAARRFVSLCRLNIDPRSQSLSVESPARLSRPANIGDFGCSMCHSGGR